MENKVKQAIKLLDGYSYVLAISEGDDTVATAKGSLGEVAELIGALMANAARDLADKTNRDLREATKLVIKNCTKACLETVLLDALEEALSNDTTLDAELVQALKGELAC